jgi:hypothetical protein
LWFWHLGAALRLVQLGASWRLPRGTAAAHTVPQLAVLRIAGAQVRVSRCFKLHLAAGFSFLAVLPEVRCAVKGAEAGYGLWSGHVGPALMLVELGASWLLVCISRQFCMRVGLL